MATHEFLDPLVVSRLGRLDLVARTLVEGFLNGVHFSPARGSSTEFAAHRPYVPGDEIRKIDWRTFARTDRYYLKEYEAETNVRAVLVVDASASMGFPTGELSRFRYASCLAAALGFLLRRQGDAVGAALVDTGVRSFLPPKSTAQHLNTIFQTLENATPDGETRVADALQEVASRLRRRSLAIVLSDLIEEAGPLIRALTDLRHRGWEAIVFHVMSPSEQTLPVQGTARFCDPEAPGIQLRLDARQVSHWYREQLEAHRDALRRGCLAATADYVPVWTSEPFEAALSSYLALRKRGGGRTRQALR